MFNQIGAVLDSAGLFFYLGYIEERPMKNVLLTLVLCVSSAGAQQIITRAQLDILLDDAIKTENFEGVSIHGGTSIAAPNPLSNDTAPFGWGVEIGVTYSTLGDLRIVGSFSGGDEDNLLSSSDDLLIEFDQPQAVVGFYQASNSIQTRTVTFYNDLTEVGSIDVLNTAGSGFVGWQAEIGITHIVVSFANIPSSSIVLFDDLTFGFNVAPCPADLAAPFGVLDLGDINAFIQGFVENEDFVDLTPPVNVLDLADISAFINSFMAGCP